MDKQLNEYISFRLEDDIMIGTYQPHKLIDLPAAHKIVHDRLKLFAGNNYPCLINARDMKAIVFTKEARDYFAKEGVEGMKALAILVESYLSKIVANLFMTFSRPEVPIKIFTDQRQAIQWLRKYDDK